MTRSMAMRGTILISGAVLVLTSFMAARAMTVGFMVVRGMTLSMAARAMIFLSGAVLGMTRFMVGLGMTLFGVMRAMTFFSLGVFLRMVATTIPFTAGWAMIRWT